jgi:pimeloyl-ACP methyl ester carboxylesterase
MQTKEFSYKGKRLVYYTTGEGPLVVLLHGFGEDASIWKNQYDIFPGCCLVVPDLPGSGKSELIEDMSMEGLADAVKALIEGLSAPFNFPDGGEPNQQPSFKQQADSRRASGISGELQLGKAPPPEGLGEARATLIGHSMGGYVTLAFAENYPEALAAFGLFHSTAFADSEEKKDTRRKGIAFIQQYGGTEFLKASTPNLYAPATREKAPQLIEQHLGSSRNFSGAALVSYYEAMIRRPDRTGVLRNSKVPVLFVLGRYDVAVPLEDGLKLCHLPQLSYIHLLDNSGHMGMVEEPDLSNNILSQFMTTVARTAYT